MKELRFVFELVRQDGRPNSIMTDFAQALKAPPGHYTQVMFHGAGGITANPETGGIVYTGEVMVESEEQFIEDIETIAKNSDQRVARMDLTLF